MSESITALRFASLGSGSAGNATLIAYGDRAVLIDCGFSAKEAVARMRRLNFAPEQLDGILVTHEHGDHAKGVSVLSRKFSIPVYSSRGTSQAAKFSAIPQLNVVAADASFQVGSMHVQPITVPHDAREPLQFIVTVAGLRLGVLTDLGSITTSVIRQYSSCHGLLVEANHDLDMLARGPYPYSVQQRVSGPWGHLNNQQTANLLMDIDLTDLQHLVVGHISVKNNCLATVKQVLADIVADVPNVVYANQDEGFTWLELVPVAGLQLNTGHMC